ncbi:MAG: hypothetical protein RMM53_04090 [Bacteroidia bacterium]|nr:hypothetical protein [Bacteroidia bacterium]MDW8333377.1 hypothetical protein [Bacteroidia bacterium]
MNATFNTTAPVSARERMATLEKLFPAREPRPNLGTQTPKPAPTVKRALARPGEIVVGSTVKVNHYRGTVRQIITHVESLDKVTGMVRRVPLTNPLYEIELDLSARYRWVESALQVYVPQGCKRLRLFADEFEPMREDEPPVRALKS